jgi:very-short-patch-repair endonuclease
VTTPARTLLDLAAAGSISRVELALDEARALRLVSQEEVAELAGSGRRGGAVLRGLIADAPGFTRSEAERRLRALARRARLPPPRTNVRLHGHELDAYWPQQRLAVEVDSYAFHTPRAAFEGDRRRDQELMAHGVRVARVTWRQLADEPEAVVARLAAGLATGPRGGAPMMRREPDTARGARSPPPTRVADLG